jgi:hypothetical protein
LAGHDTRCLDSSSASERDVSPSDTGCDTDAPSLGAVVGDRGDKVSAALDRLMGEWRNSRDLVRLRHDVIALMATIDAPGPGDKGRS